MKRQDFPTSGDSQLWQDVNSKTENGVSVTGKLRRVLEDKQKFDLV